MGMFNWVVCQDPLPCKGYENTRFQTKSTPCNMWLLVIRGNRLYQMPDFDPEESHLDSHWEAVLDGTSTPIQYDGDLYFYHYVPYKGRVLFKASFQKGRLVKPIDLIEDTIEHGESCCQVAQ